MTFREPDDPRPQVLAKRLDEAARAAQAKAEAAAKRARWKRNAWSRHWDGFCDRPVFRRLAKRLGLPLTQVIAFVVRLDELANKAESRGSVEDFSAEEFAIALDMSDNETASIFAELAHPEIGYIAYDHIADFYDRNRDSDSDKEAAKERKRRSRGKAKAFEITARLAHRGEITAAQRDDIERDVSLPPKAFSNEDFFKLLDELYRADLSTGRGHRWSQCDAVTVTQEQTRPHLLEGGVDNSGATTRGNEEGPSEEGVAGTANDPQAQAAQWIAIEGRRIVIARMPSELPGKVDMLLERWLNQDLDGNAGALMTVLIECDRLNLAGSMFHVEVTRRCDQHRKREALRQEPPRLPLGGIQPVKKSGSA
jgi:hypothetical protein